jgi:hypothetical protein
MPPPRLKARQARGRRDRRTAAHPGYPPGTARPFAFAPRAGRTLPCFTDAGPKSGPFRWEHRLDALGVLASPDDHAPIGVALALAMDEDRRSLWRRTVHGAKVSGVFIVADREFVPARGGSRQDARIQRAVALGQRSPRTGTRMVRRPGDLSAPGAEGASAGPPSWSRGRERGHGRPVFWPTVGHRLALRFLTGRHRTRRHLVNQYVAWRNESAPPTQHAGLNFRCDDTREVDELRPGRFGRATVPR